MALIQLPGGWLRNTMTEGGDGDPEKGAELKMEFWDFHGGPGLPRKDPRWDNGMREWGSQDAIMCTGWSKWEEVSVKGGERRGHWVG